MLHLRGALSDERRPLTAEQTGVVRKALKQAEAIVARFQVTLDPASATLEVDGSPAVVEEGELLLDPVRHEIAASAPGHRRERRIVDARGGATATLRMELEPERGGAVAAMPEQGAGAQSESGREVSAESPTAGGDADRGDDGGGFAEGRLWTWVALGGAGAFGAAAVVFGLVGNAEYDELMTKCDNGCDDEQIEQEIDDSGVRSSQVLANVSLALSGACLAAAVALYFVESPPESESPAVAAAVGPGGVHLAGSF